jgi:hypothetical protein
MPRQGIGIGTQPSVRGQGKTLSMKSVVRVPVLEVLPKALPDDEAALGVDGHVSAVEQTVNVAAEGETVTHRVHATPGIWMNVSRLEDGK